MRNLKGLIFGVLVLGLCVFVNPNTVFAASCEVTEGSNKYSITTAEGPKYCQTLTDAFTEVSENGTIKVLGADTIGSLVHVTKSVTLDLNGQKLTVSTNN